MQSLYATFSIVYNVTRLLGSDEPCLGADGSVFSERRKLSSALFCRQFNIGDTVYVLCKNNNGTEGDINYLQIV